MEFRRISVEAAEDLAVLSVATFRLAYGDLHSAENIAAYCAAVYTPAKMHHLLSDPLIHCEMAWLDGVPMGYVMVSHHKAPAALGEPSSELKRLYILPDGYGTGLGQALYARALAVTQGRLWLSVADINLRARRFYDKLGFQALGVGPVFRVGTDRVTSTLMAQTSGV